MVQEPITGIKEEAFLPVVIKACCCECGTEMKKEDVSYLHKIVGKKGTIEKIYKKRFLYVCPNCRHQEQSDIDYPYVKYKRAGFRERAN